jgi:hypothetical protein
VTYVYPWRVVVFFTKGWILLLSLFVCWNAEDGEIGDEGAIGIAKGLEKNTTLKKLDLGRGVFPPHLFFIQSCIFGRVMSCPTHTRFDEL